VVKNIFKKEKPRVFLGTLAVVPRTDFKKTDEWGVFKSEDFDSHLRERMMEVFSLPPYKEAENPTSSDLVLDVVVPKYQSGDYWDVDLGFFGFPFFWRPKVEIKSRLYYLKTNKTKKVFAVTEKLRWGSYISKLFTWRALFRYRPIFDSNDIDYLFFNACQKLLLKMKEAI
jgi:hypothetical protein